KRRTARCANTAERRATHNAVEHMCRETLNGRFLVGVAVCVSIYTYARFFFVPSADGIFVDPRIPPTPARRRPSKAAIVSSRCVYFPCCFFWFALCWRRRFLRGMDVLLRRLWLWGGCLRFLFLV
ncbi:hypothetical protein DFH08DRAFT_723605, partial [Mycena albidolilacea]